MVLISAFIAALVRMALSAVLLFGAAGGLTSLRGWAVLVFLSGFSALGQIVLALEQPALAAERLRPGHGRPGADKVLGAALALSFNLWLVAMGLEWRFGAPLLPDWLIGPGFGLSLAGQALSYAAQQANRFASSVVRIQTERGHRVEERGPYEALRHPMYAANLLLLIGGALMAGSVAGLMLIPLFLGLFIMRIALEERVLRAALPAYAAYAAAVRWRLIPYLF